MNAKERFYSGLAKETIGKITSNTDNWTSFLRTMSRNYEFTYPEQVMIYAQRPNATFCKPYEDWNAENYRRYVKRGSTGIALFVMNRDKPYLRYVFDVADTGVRRSSPELKPWEVTPENRSYVMEAMERTFGVAADGVLEAQLEDIASALAAEYWDDYKKQFLDIVANSFLEEYDELNIEVAFKNAVANSVSYTMYCRFVESPDNYFEHEDFQKVFDFNTRQTVNALGTAVNAISTRMFQEIEKAIGEHEQIKATERSTDYERDDLQTGRRLSDSEPSVGERGRETSGQVRQDASSIFGTEQSDAPERHDSDGEPVPAPVGDRGNSESQSGVSDGAVPEGQPRTGQGNAADGVGAAHEQPESTGGGSRDDGAYQQLSLNLFLSENEQISFIDRAESFTPSAFSFAQEEIDHFLLLGSNTDEARKVVALEYMKQKPLEEIVQTLKQVYHGGYGLKEDSGNICAWYAEDGIHLAKGSSAIDSPRAQIVSWETVAERIGELLENGRFATNVELVEASGYERQKLAESLWHLYHDLSEEARSSNYLAILHQEPFRGFPDETADLAEKLDDPRFHATLVQQYSEFRKTLAENPDLLRFHYHKLNLIQKQLYELNMPLREYQTDMMQMPLVRQFITDDEVNADLTRGSGFSGGKARIYNYWQENHSAKEKMDFLKHEYGTGGHSHACSGATHSGQDHDAKGVAYTKSGCDKLQMSWAQVVQRIDGLIRKGRYLSPEEEAERQAIEEAKTDPLEDVYDRFAVIDTEDGEYAIWDNQTDDYYVDPEGVTEYFTDEWLANDYLEEVRQSVAAMESVQPEAPVAEPAEVVEASASEEPKWNYQVGDTVYLDDTAFRVEQITDREVQLRDPTLAYPIFRAENRENFERMLSQDERNHAVRVDAQTEEKPVTEDFLGKTEPRDYTPEYQLLDRLRMDCEYFLGAGQHSEKHLWAGNRHSVVYTYTDENGNKRQKWETFETNAEAKKRKLQVEYEQESGTFIPPSAKTVNDLLDEYMSIYGVNTWAMSTYESRKSLIANYIRPLIGDMKLEDVTPRIMDKYYRDLLSVKAVSSKYVKARTEYLTPHTVREVHKTLRNAFNQAVKWELMTRNPVEHATLPKEEHKTRDIWTAEVLQKALEACDDDILRLAINLAFSCSLRMGELLGLTWDCIDISPTSIELGQASIFVEKELQRVNREAMADLDGKDIMFKFPPTFASTHTALVLKTPKTKTSVRKVFLPKTVAEMLVQRKADIEELKDLFGDEFVDFNLVFCSSNGKPIEGQVINRAFNKLIEEKGLPKVVFHSLRHSSITYKLKLNGGDMKSVQGDSGHAQVKMVADVYSHIIDDDRRLNAERMEAAFYSGRQATPEPVQPAATESSADDKELLLKLLQNPEMAALLKSLAKTL